MTRLACQHFLQAVSLTHANTRQIPCKFPKSNA
jgi:hypothetical protein